VGRHQPWAHEVFHHYRRRLGRRYGSVRELEHRQSIFVHNMNVTSEATSGIIISPQLGATPSDLTPNRGQGSHSLSRPIPLSPGAVTPVKDQAVCGSCWSFATTGAMEGALFLKTGVLTPLSQQVLIDCSWGFGQQSCTGKARVGRVPAKGARGFLMTQRPLPWVLQNGLCHYNQSEMLAKITGYVNVTSGNITAVKAAIYKHGPVAVSIDASHKTFSFYSNGIYYEPKCANVPGMLDHAVLAVGYGVLQGETYWLIKNSWSTYWGNDGYILMAMKENNCGVATEATYPILA
ncbi:Digestive cysteine proteinase 2, partial [Apaloderma vittatum]